MAIFSAQSFTQMARRVLDVYAYHKNRKGEIQSTDEKTTLSGDDVLVLEDSADGFAKKRIKASNLAVGSSGSDTTAVHVDVANEFNAIPNTTPVSSDKLLVEKGVDGSKAVVTVSSLPVTPHSHSINDVTGLQPALDGKENSFPKNSAFNKDFGVGVGTVAEGNHTHSGLYAPLAHTHTVSNTTGLQAALDSKTETSSNSGAGEGLALPKVGNNLPFKSIVAGNNVTISSQADTITIEATGGGGGGGTDHGVLAGLGDDDHLQYHNDARGDARYSQLNHTHAGVYEPVFSKNTGFNLNLGTAAGEVAEGNHNHGTVYSPIGHDHNGVYAPVTHTHSISEVTGLQPALDSKVESSSSSGAGVGLVLPKVGVDLPFKSLVAGPNVTLTDNGNDITIGATAGGGGGVYLHDTGTNLFPVFVDTHRGNKVLSAETIETVFGRNGTAGANSVLYHVYTQDLNQGWMPHINTTIVAATIAFESASSTGNLVDVLFIDAVTGVTLTTITGLATTNGTSRVISSVITTDVDLNQENVTVRIVTQGGGTTTDPKVTIYTRWRF